MSTRYHRASSSLTRMQQPNTNFTRKQTPASSPVTVIMTPTISAVASISSSSSSSSRIRRTPSSSSPLFSASSSSSSSSSSSLSIITKPSSSSPASSLKLLRHKRNTKGYSSNTAFLALATSSLLIISILILFICIGNVTSLSCYQCSSYDNPACDESFSIGANLTGAKCDEDDTRKAKVCRKLVQYIEHKKVVIRECGYLNEHYDKEHKPMCLKRSGTFALMMESCICYDDNCNHSASLVPNQSVLLLTLLLASGSIMLMLGNHNSLPPPLLATKHSNKL